MKQKRVWLVSGLPGCGKSTWIHNKMLTTTGNLYCSRDEIRFSLLEEGEDYFSKEDLVFKTFVETIQNGLNNPEVENIFIDATHLNDGSRKKILNQLSLPKNAEIIHTIFNTPLKICLERNALREGRARVPDDVIISMSKKFYPPKIRRSNESIVYINERGEEN